MHVGLERLQPLLVRDAEMLLLVHHQQAEIGELDRLRQQRMGADDDVDRAVGEAAAHLGRLLRRHHARQLRDLHRQPGEALGERAEMLPRQQRRRHHHRDLRARHRGDERGAQRDLGLAEADIAADQPVHRPARRQILQHIGDGARLVLGLGEREAGAELVPGALGRRHDLGVADLARGGDADQLTRHVADALLHPRLARLPADAAQLVQRDALLLAAEARQHLDVLDRQEQLFVAVVDQPQAVVRRAGDGQRRQPVVAADAVFLVHHQIALGDLGRLGDELIGALAPARRAADALAQQVLLADQGKLIGDEAALHAQRDQRDRAGRLAADRRPVVLLRGVLEAVLAQQIGQPLARAAGPGGDDDPPALAVPAFRLRRAAGRTRWSPGPPPLWENTGPGRPPPSTPTAPSGLANGVNANSGPPASISSQPARSRYSRSGGSGRYGTSPSRGTIRRAA